MKITPTNLQDVLLIEPSVYGDERGYFMETYRQDLFRDQVTSMAFVQDNHSKSNAGVLRGLHYQITQPQGKLIRVVVGEVYDVIVDLRQSSSSFGQWQGFYLSSDNKRQLWVPPGFAHGFYVTKPDTEFVYKCTDYYAPQFERTLCWNDSDLAIDWPLPNACAPILSKKDLHGTRFCDAETFE